jgi:hypothetical protein
MTKIALAALAATLILSGTAQAQSFADRLVSQFSEQGFTRMEVKNGPTQTKVEAIRGNQKVEVVYDQATGSIIKQESQRVRSGDDRSAGVEIRDRDSDFVDDRDGAGRADDDTDEDRGRGRGSDDASDDHDDDSSGHGSDHGSDSGDDHDSDSDHGGDDGDHDRGGDSSDD